MRFIFPSLLLVCTFLLLYVRLCCCCMPTVSGCLSFICYCQYTPLHFKCKFAVYTKCGHVHNPTYTILCTCTQAFCVHLLFPCTMHTHRPPAGFSPFIFQTTTYRCKPWLYAKIRQQCIVVKPPPRPLSRCRGNLCFKFWRLSV